MGTVRTTFITDADHVITEVITKVDTKKPPISFCHCCSAYGWLLIGAVKLIFLPTAFESCS